VIVGSFLSRLPALSLGVGAPAEDFSGTVAAVHPRVCLVSLADEGLLTLVAPEIGRLPRSIRFDAPPGFTFENAVSVGADISARAGVLRIADSPISIDLRCATFWRSPLRDLRLDSTHGPVADALSAARAALEQDGRHIGLVRLAGGRFSALATTTRALDAVGAGEAMSGLVGLGEGATPAGDDFLVGYFAALWACAAATEPRLAFLAALSRRVGQIASRTGRVSRTYLEAAAEGEVSERLFDLAMHISAGSGADTIRRVARAAVAVGHSSGACGLYGFLEACSCWAAAAPPRGEDGRRR
jgi:hypothetical protein